MPDATYVIFLNGSYGVGKSSTLDHVGDLLVDSDSDRAFCLMDVDWSRFSQPEYAEAMRTAQATLGAELSGSAAGHAAPLSRRTRTTPSNRAE